MTDLQSLNDYTVQSREGLIQNRDAEVSSSCLMWMQKPQGLGHPLLFPQAMNRELD